MTPGGSAASRAAYPNGGDGGAPCPEGARCPDGGPCPDGAPVWRKSSYSASNGGQCVEVARNLPALVAVRDSTDPDGARLLLPPAAWAAFVDRVKCEGWATATKCPSSTSNP